MSKRLTWTEILKPSRSPGIIRKRKQSRNEKRIETQDEHRKEHYQIRAMESDAQQYPQHGKNDVVPRNQPEFGTETQRHAQTPDKLPGISRQDWGTWHSVGHNSWQKSIDLNLLRFNRNHFRAASAFPCGQGIIQEKVTFISLSQPAKDLLNGLIPQEWYGNDELLQEFLSSFAKPESINTMDPISTHITEEDVKFGFGKWEESTSTSPSGRHLGHYKAIIQDKHCLKTWPHFPKS